MVHSFLFSKLKNFTSWTAMPVLHASHRKYPLDVSDGISCLYGPFGSGFGSGFAC
jgi:hypothetical protein